MYITAYVHYYKALYDNFWHCKEVQILKAVTDLLTRSHVSYNRNTTLSFFSTYFFKMYSSGKVFTLPRVKSVVLSFCSFLITSQSNNHLQTQAQFANHDNNLLPESWNNRNFKLDLELNFPSPPASTALENRKNA